MQVYKSAPYNCELHMYLRRLRTFAFFFSSRVLLAWRNWKPDSIVTPSWIVSVSDSTMKLLMTFLLSLNSDNTLIGYC